MKKWVTEIKALHPHTGEMKTWGGDNIEAPTWKLAQQWCDENKGYLKIVGELVAEIPFKEGDGERIDYDIITNN